MQIRMLVNSYVLCMRKEVILILLLPHVNCQGSVNGRDIFGYGLWE